MSEDRKELLVSVAVAVAIVAVVALFVIVTQVTMGGGCG